MNRSVVETGYIGTSPSRNYRSVGTKAPLRWIKNGALDFKHSPTISITWGAAFAATLYVTMSLFGSPITAAYLYIAPLTMLLVVIAGGMSAYSRQRAAATGSNMTAAIIQLWHAKFHLFLLSVTIASLVVLLMRLVSMTHVAFTGLLIPEDSSFLSIFLATDNWTVVAVHSVITLSIMALLFALTHLAIPMIIDGDQDFMNAMLASLIATSENKLASLLWAAIFIGTTIAGVLLWPPVVAFLAPVLFYGAWHGYSSMVATE